jgi:osmotically-inducible protein OsmY
MSAQSNADGKLVQQVNAKLSMRGIRSPCNVTVTVARGEVTLSGTVTQPHQKLSAAQVAQSMSGVKRVHNQLTVKAAERRT